MYIATLDNKGVPTIKITSPDFSITLLEVKLFADKAIVVTPDTKYNVEYGSEDSGEESGHVNAERMEGLTLAELNTTETFIRNIARSQGLIEEVTRQAKERGQEDPMKFIKKSFKKNEKFMKKVNEVSIQ